MNEPRPQTDKLIAIVLGGTAPHIALIHRLKARGYHTVLVDYLQNPPAAAYADEHVKESTLDKERVLAIASEIKADLVISACVDQANVTACYVGEKLGLPIPYSYECSLRVTNKLLMKADLLAAGIQTSRFIQASSVDDVISSQLSYPLMLKPADSCSSNAVKKAETLEEALLFFKDALQASRSKTVVVEEFVEGREVSVYAFVQAETVEILLTAERHSIIDGPEKVLKCFCTTAPANISAVVKEKILRQANLIVRAFALSNTPLHLQVLISDEDVSVIEFAPRVGGGLSYKTIFDSTGFDIIDATIDSYLGITSTLIVHEPTERFAISILYACPATLGAVIGYESLLSEGIVDEFHAYKIRGMLVEGDRASASRVGAFILRAPNENGLKQKLGEIAERVDVVDVKGDSIFRRDIAMLQRTI
ncbi:MAG: ATP-grasp domain-containing protein [Wenzhouxiangella sp.]